MWLIECNDEVALTKIKLVSTLLLEPITNVLTKDVIGIWRHESAPDTPSSLPVLKIYNSPQTDGISFTASADDWQCAISEIKLINRHSNLVGRSSSIAKVRNLIERAAPSDVCVLITGESGTGKEVVARELHRLSNRADKPFVPVNCAAIPNDLLESELFGHEKGAFTGALSSRKGRFELAKGGTIFLDEIGDMPLNMQVKLLRVLQEKTFERIGSGHEHNMQARVIAATNQNLDSAIKEGAFREDLFFRLNVFPIELSPLRERIEDLEPLIEFFSERVGFSKKALSPEALSSLQAWQWPGNIRELENLLERLFVLNPEGNIDTNALPERYQGHCHRDKLTSTILSAKSPVDLKAHIVDIEKQMIMDALSATNGIVAQAAKHLSLRRTTLVEKMRKYQISATRQNSNAG